MIDPFEILGVPPAADDEAIRAAYVAKVREHPPEREPEQFERIRDAYELLRNPRRRMQRRLFAVDPLVSFASLFDARQATRRFAGPGPWLEILKEQERSGS